MWKLEWDGGLSAGGFAILFGGLSLMAFGIGTAWVRMKTAGLAPLAIALGYNISTALALTSGGRYMLPFEWLVILYFGIGMVELIRWLGMLLKPSTGTALEALQPDSPQPVRQTPRAALAVTVFTFLFLGSLPVLLEFTPPERYVRQANIADFLEANQAIPDFPRQQVDALVQDPAARIYNGRALYPRYYEAKQGDISDMTDPLLAPFSFDRLTFYLAGPTDENIVLPVQGVPNDFIPGADAWVLGCQREGYVEAVVVILRDRENVRLYSQPELKPTCE
jgi:hypothetical protein